HHFPLVAAVRVAELAPAHEFHAGVARLQAFLEKFEHLVAAKHLVPGLRDSLAGQRVGTRRERFHLGLARAARPERFVISVISSHDLDSFRKNFANAKNPPTQRRGSSALPACTLSIAPSSRRPPTTARR